jgi:hypothetical protein
MSSLKVSQIRAKLLPMFESFLDLKDIGGKDPEREAKVLSRCLAALAIYIQTGCTEKEAAESVWDGSDDNGIDAAYFSPSDQRVVIVQAKWITKGSGEPEAKDIGAFTKGVREIIEQDSTNFHVRLRPRFEDLTKRLVNPGTSVHLVLISTGASDIARHGASVISALLSELNGDDPDAIASSEVMGLAEVYSGLSNDVSQNNLTLDATLLDWSFIVSPFSAYFGMIDGLQLKNWWRTYGKGLVSMNIRHSLGSTEVNNEIKQSAALAPDRFWYFNNGITLIANEAEKAPAGAAARSAGVFRLKSASIVNGAQTVSSLAKVDDDASLGMVRVPIRIILLKDAPAGFGAEVTRTNNLQNRVEPRDFVAHDPEQKRLRQEMAIEGIDYEFVRSEDVIATPTSCELVELTTAMACALGDANLAVQVKTGIGRFFGDLSKAPYKTIYNPTLSGARAFNAVTMHRAIEKWIEEKKLTVAKRSGPPWGALVHGNRILAASAFKKAGAAFLTQPIATFKDALAHEDLDSVCEDAYSKLVDGIEQNYSGKFLAVLFKNPKMSKHLFDISST